MAQRDVDDFGNKKWLVDPRTGQLHMNPEYRDPYNVGYKKPIAPITEPPGATDSRSPNDVRITQPVTDPYDNLFVGTPYGNTQGAKDLIYNYKKNLGIRGWKPEEINSQVQGYANEFASQFKNLVGRDPTSDEYSKFFQSVVVPDQPWMQPLNPDQFGQRTGGHIYNTYSRTAQDEQQKRTEDKANQSTARNKALNRLQKYVGISSKWDTGANSGDIHDALVATLPGNEASNPNALKASDVSDATLAKMGLSRSNFMDMLKQRDILNSQSGEEWTDLPTFFTDQQPVTFPGGDSSYYTPQVEGLINQFRTDGNKAIDRYQESVNKSIDDVGSSLADFQSRLMEKIRPQLLTSLQAQGLLNTGGLNEAFAGQAKDLTDTASQYMAGLKSSAAQDVAGQRLQNEQMALDLPRNIQSQEALADLQSRIGQQQLPFELQRQNTLGQMSNMTQYGQNALQNAWNYSNNANLANLNYQNQSKLLSQQQGYQPSPLYGIGGQILGGVAGGLASRWGR